MAALARSLGRAGFQSLTREPVRQVGGSFEELEELPAPKTQKAPGTLPPDLLNQLLSALQFTGTEQVIQPGRQLQFAQRSPFGRASQAVAASFTRFSPFRTGFFG